MGILDRVITGIRNVVSAAADVVRGLFGARQSSQQQPLPNDPVGAPASGGCGAMLSERYPEIISGPQAQRGDEKLARLSPAERERFLRLIERAGSCQEAAYLWKAFAACHSVAECEAFGDKIRNKDVVWMRDNLQLANSSTGTGVQQQWSHSCNATTAEALRGQMDPVYALQTHEANPNMGQVDGNDPTKFNPNLAEEQRRMLTSTYHGPTSADHAGTAVGRDQAGGSGRWADDLFNQNSSATGVTYATSLDPSGAQAVNMVDQGLQTGAPVPIVIGNGPGQYTHYVMVLSSDPGPPKTYLIHDPWSGQTVTRTEDQMRNGTLDIAGSNQVTAVERPTPLPANSPQRSC
jgi:hypothetical protein